MSVHHVRMQRLIRLLRLAWLLEDAGPAGMRAPEIVRRLGVSRRTVYRDLELVALVLPVTSVGGVWRWVGRRERRAA